MILNTIPTFKIAIQSWKNHKKIIFRTNRTFIFLTDFFKLINFVIYNKTKINKLFIKRLGKTFYII